MRCGAIVMSTKDSDELFRVKGIINSKEGKKIAILEELCKSSTRAKFAYLDSLKVVWAPKILKDSQEEYNVTELDENILLDQVDKC